MKSIYIMQQLLDHYPKCLIVGSKQMQQIGMSLRPFIHHGSASQLKCNETKRNWNAISASSISATIFQLTRKLECLRSKCCARILIYKNIYKKKCKQWTHCCITKNTNRRVFIGAHEFKKKIGRNFSHVTECVRHPFIELVEIVWPYIRTPSFLE